ncbi:AAA family ATPase [Castellaniella sp.]|uniref:AAA family ATPase n=1 Tax=Castellaniella sp. TaxID=1955812 RepID=UPI002AFF692E|nr:AAA family ATPase [Castellaniella sp.]
MKLQSIRIEQLRQFHDPLEINGLVPGINLFTGPNESGKSTLVQAIRAAFFERHKSSAVEDLQPWGDSSAAPSVQLDFTWQDQHWILNKRFLKQKRCDLNIDGQLFNGEEAEEKLAELLGYRFPGRGISKAEHWGIPGLLWIAQGSGQDIHDPVQHAADYLKAALGESLGEVASTSGEALINQVHQERASLLTGTGRPTGAYAEAKQQSADYASQLATLDDDIAAYQQQVDHLGELLQLQKSDVAQPWLAYREQAAQAQAKLSEVQEWEQAQQREYQDLRHCQDKQTLCRDQLTAFAKQQTDLTQRSQAKDLASQALNALKAQQPQIDSQLSQAKSAYQAADDALRQARQQEQRHTLSRESSQLSLDLTELGSRLEQARTLQAQLLEQRNLVQDLHVDKNALKQLRHIHQELANIDIAQRAVATRLHFDLLPGRHILLNDATLVATGERLLTEAVILNVPEVGTLRIQPGGEDIADLARRRLATQDRLNACLTALQVDSIEHAELQAEQRQAHLDAISRHELLLGSLAAHGIDELIRQQTQGEQRQQALTQQLAELPEATPDGISLNVAESALEQTRAQLHAAERQLGDFDKHLSLAQQAVTNTQAEWQKLHTALQTSAHQDHATALNQQLLDLHAQESGLQQRITNRQAQIDTARPEILRQDIQRYSHTAAALEKEAQDRSLEIARLQSKLDALGAHGLEEQRAKLTLKSAQTKRRHDELQRHAAALDMLLALLNAKRQALTRRIQAPLQRHLDHYLQLLFPQSRLSVNEDLSPEQLIRSTHGRETHDAFPALSYGAREQMGLISRLAYADLLQAAGRPTLIILDDALVHSDPQRLSHMKRVLFDAAQRHQILLFTCHPDNWKDLGVTATTMQALRTR